MYPTLKDSDIVFFKKYIKRKTPFKVGQIVIFYHPIENISLIKRIKSVSKNSIEVFGDNTKFSDDSRKFGFINYEEVIGIVTSKITSLKLKNILSENNITTFLEPK